MFGKKKKQQNEGMGEFWDKWQEETVELERKNREMTEKIVGEAKEKNRKQEKRWEEMQKYNVKVSKCYLIQVLDDVGNEVVCEYSFNGTKREAEERGYIMLQEVVDNENRN